MANYQVVGSPDSGYMRVGTAGQHYDSTYVDGASIGNYLEPAYSSLSQTGQTEVWLHWSMATTGDGCWNGTPIWNIYDDSRELIAWGRSWGNQNFSLTVYNGSSTTVGDLVVYSLNTIVTVDVHIVLHDTNGVVDIYIDGELHASHSGDTIGTLTGRTVGHFEGTGGTTHSHYYSELVWGNGANSTLGKRVYSKAPTGDSTTNNAWTGGYADAAGGIMDGHKIIRSGVATQRQGFTFPALPYNESPIVGVSLSSASIGDLRSYKHSARISSTDYDFDDVSSTELLTRHEEFEPTSPATASAWTVSEIDGAEFGVVTT